jgi:predicted DNA-binding protein (MmcQ/YjbR family)/CheY-like chemotaxis protein
MSLEALATKLRAIALGYPETYEEQPWGDRVVKVKGKIFFLCGVHAGQLYVTVKAKKSGKKLLERPYAEPTHYGMGKHGWVTMKFAKEKDVPVGEIPALIDESFAEVAPKRLVGAKAASAPATKAKASGRALLVCADKLRAQRAVKALEARGVACDVVATADAVKLGKARALIVDIGRNPPDGIALAQKIDASDKPIHLFVAGVRDADQQRKLRDLGSAETFRAPPGDAAVADAVAAALTKGGARRGS